MTQEIQEGKGRRNKDGKQQHPQPQRKKFTRRKKITDVGGKPSTTMNQNAKRLNAGKIRKKKK